MWSTPRRLYHSRRPAYLSWASMRPSALARRGRLSNAACQLDWCEQRCLRTVAAELFVRKKGIAEVLHHHRR
eukprot:5615006-Prymnesium_polylepis.2